MKFYIPAMILPALLYSIAMLILVFIYGGNSDDEVICVLVAVYSGQLNSIWGISSTLINLATIILYVILSQVVVKAKTNNRGIYGTGTFCNNGGLYVGSVLGYFQNGGILYDMPWWNTY
ncbi:hypothetical protein LOAG_15369 [Loa loa]|uniref:Uncharacterized protein n=1 Tax=Loa loa TaxID=7209 RepID=A0A1S0TG00_LOALO|nr:hypothetical protein LOAG_15369 [Loa loa]EFO13161.1 hypothetical protein LOAG_15369 [Loa loa]